MAKEKATAASDEVAQQQYYKLALYYLLSPEGAKDGVSLEKASTFFKIVGVFSKGNGLAVRRGLCAGTLETVCRTMPGYFRYQDGKIYRGISYADFELDHGDGEAPLPLIKAAKSISYARALFGDMPRVWRIKNKRMPYFLETGYCTIDDGPDSDLAVPTYRFSKEEIRQLLANGVVGRFGCKEIEKSKRMTQ